jgi:hypothetical protein
VDNTLVAFDIAGEEKQMSVRLATRKNYDLE